MEAGDTAFVTQPDAAEAESAGAKIYDLTEMLQRTRNGIDWTSRLTVLAKQLKAIKLPEGCYDGEIVILNEQGLPDFQALQNAFDNSRTEDIVYYLFDLPFCDGLDLRKEARADRREKLRELLVDVASESIRFSDTFDVMGRDIRASACKLGLKGVIVKESPGQTSAKVERTNSLRAMFKVTNPERCVDKSSSTRKIDVVHYYALVAPL